MSPSKKASVIGMLIGGALLAVGLIVLVIPVFIGGRALTSSTDFVVRHEALSTGVVSWLIGAPTGFVVGGFGALILFLSLIVYFDTKRKEHTLI